MNQLLETRLFRIALVICAAGLAFGYAHSHRYIRLDEESVFDTWTSEMCSVAYHWKGNTKVWDHAFCVKHR
ncbi:MAG: hypothetical protein M3336_04600 [Chloroflexota bacterium]|nr:hypothetical protein [Chloroflexota bacterium]